MLDFPLHPKIVHFPIALAGLLPLLTAGVLLAWWRDWLPKRSWVLVCAGQALLVLSGVAALQSGEADEERVEGVVTERALEAHEEAAEVFVWSGGAVLALALAALAVRRPRTALAVGLATTAGTLVVLALGVRVGSAGGDLVYGSGGSGGLAFAPPVAGSVHADRDDD